MGRETEKDRRTTQLILKMASAVWLVTIETSDAEH
jgi:hypothetical protein